MVDTFNPPFSTISLPYLSSRISLTNMTKWGAKISILFLAKVMISFSASSFCFGVIKPFDSISPRTSFCLMIELSGFVPKGENFVGLLGSPAKRAASARFKFLASLAK